MNEAPDGRYWCHACHRLVNPIMEPEVKCPLCDGGFVEEIERGGHTDSDSDSVRSNRSFSLWAPILLEMLGDSSRQSRSRRYEDDEYSDLDHEFEDFVRRRRRRSAIIQLLQSLQDDQRSEGGSTEREVDREIERNRNRERERGERERERESLILINPFSQAIVLGGSFDTDNNEGRESNNGSSSAAFGGYYVGSGLDVLLQHLAENDPNRYGTPPAKKEAVDALPVVKIEEAMGCSVCLEDFEIGMDAKEMPCQHKFHSDCILPWLELHSSCPVCRAQLPVDESKDSNAFSNGTTMEVSDGGGGDDERGDRGDHSRFWVPVPWPFNGLFSLSGSLNNANSSSNATSSSSNSENSNSHREEN